jgi:hypothetical protein
MTFKVAERFNQGVALAGNIQQQQQRNQINQLQQGLGQQIQQGGFNPESNLDFQQLALLDPARSQIAMNTFSGLDDKRKKAYFSDMRSAREMIETGDDNGFLNLFSNRLEQVERLKGDTQGTKMIIDKFTSGDKQGVHSGLMQAEKAGIELGFLSDPLDREIKKARGGISSETKTFQDLLAKAGLSEEEAQTAARIKLGLDPRAVGSADQTISQKGIANQIGDVKATIKQREKFAELTAVRRSKVIDNGFNKIEKINAAVGNIDRAIGVLNSGAGVGAIEKFLPSFKAASVELDNIQKSMALDVIGATTFGALSEGELNLAKEVALPTGLDTPQLIEYLNKRKSAQNKLRDYYNEQIQFLDQGGTVAGFMRAKGRNKSQAEQPASSTNNGQLSDSDLLKKYGG